MGRSSSCSPARERRTAIGYRLNGLILPDHPFMEFFFEQEEFSDVHPEAFFF